MRKVMFNTSAMVACMLTSLAICPAVHGKQAYLPAGDGLEMVAAGAGADSSDSRLYSDGQKAIHEGKWADAVKLFDQVAVQEGEHAPAALYWKAYAQNKMKQPEKALDTCVSLQMRFAKSGWVEDCGALEIEIQASKGQPVKPQPGQSDELKLLALSTLMQKDPQGARAQIEELVQSDSSEPLKERALFLLGESAPELRYAQVVRISHLEGDVRIARASANEKSKHEVWETAEMNLPLATDDSLVTGADGRVEIEFENASTLYLAPNSVMTFDDLHATSGVPHSELDLLSGTATIHLDSLKPGESFFVRTATNDLLTRYPQKADMRISSYTDGMALVALKDGSLIVPGGSKEAMTAGKVIFFNKDHAQAAAPEKTQDFAEFDAWVADRYQARSEAMSAEMKEAGITTPVPGIADMKGQGRFYPCEPYGTCWEPNSGNGNSVLASGPAQAPAPRSAGTPARPATPADVFPCFPSMSGPRTYLTMSAFDPTWWTLCHSGSWVRRGNRYAWVAGTKIHHHFPVHWIHFGHTVAFVPVHPKDVRGQVPVNRELGFTTSKEKGGGYVLNPIKLEGPHSVQVMKSAPRDFRNAPTAVLGRAEAPHMEMHAVREMAVARAGMPPAAGIPMHFNHQTGGFTAPHTVAMGGHSTTVFAAVGHSGGGYAGHSGGGSFGGGSHGGGGGGGGSFGGGSHGGGGTSSASASSSISVSSGGASGGASSSGGSHR